MYVLAIVLTVLLLVETVPSAGALLTRATMGLDRFDKLTRIGVTQGRHRWVLTLLGVLHTVGVAAVLVGLWAPVVGAVGAAIPAGVFGWVLYRQLKHGDRGAALGPYLLFTAMASAVLVVDALR